MEDDFSIDTAWLLRFGAHGRTLYTESYWNWLLHPTDSNFARGGSPPWLVARYFHEVRRTLAAGVSVTEPDADGITPLMRAYDGLTLEKKHYVTCVHPELVRVLTTTLGRTPTQMEVYGVVTHKKTRKFRLHVKKRVDEIVAKFMDAARNGDLETVRRMVESDEIGVNAVDKSTGQTALATALANDKRHVCVYLMKEGAHALGECPVDGKEGSVVLAAVRTGNVKLVRELTAHGGLLSDTRSPRVLVEAAKLGDFQMIETLLDLGFHVAPGGLSLPWPIEWANYFHLSNQREMDLWRLLFIACWFEDKALFEQLQRTHTELLDVMSNECVAAAFLVLAVYQGNEGFVLDLLQRGASVNRRVGSGITAMVAAVGVNSTAMVQLLLERGGDINLTYSSRLVGHDLSLLSMAVHADALDCVRMLLPLETRPRYRVQALQKAIKLGRIEVIDFLLAEGDDDSMMFTELVYEVCIVTTSDPVLLDSLLTRWCPSKVSFSAMNRIFARRCSANSNPATSDPAVLSVFLAHGVDLTAFAADGDGNATSTLMRDVVRTHNGLPVILVVEFLLESGVPSISVNKMGRTPEQEMDAYLQTQHRTYDRYGGFRRRLFGQCRDLFAAHSSQQALPSLRG